MNRGRQRSATPAGPAADRPSHAPIDLGLALSVYGRDARGRLVELDDRDAAHGARLHAPWPTEQ